jgi:thiamine biosynthesis lipoprotein
MATHATAEVLAAGPELSARRALNRALGWFSLVESVCSRFDPASELRQVVARVGEPVPVSPLLFEAVQFALALADLTRGAFDPTVGAAMESAGFDRHYVTDQRTAAAPGGAATYRDVDLDPHRRTIALRRPLVLDLGAVAKGLAIDLAARELAPFGDFCLEAGGDLFAGGRNERGQRWRVGVQDPRDPDAIVRVLDLADQAACTSGDYERRAAGGHHLLDPRSGRSVEGLASVTVVATTAMAADGLATAAFVLGPAAGLRLLEEQGVEGLFVTADARAVATPGLSRGEP